MMPWRRRGMIGFSAVMLSLGGGLITLLLMVDDWQELGSAFFGLAIILAAVGLLGAVRCLNWRRAEEVAAVNDANATVQFTMSRLDLGAIVFAVSLAAIGFCFWVFDGFFIVIRILGGAGLIGCAFLPVCLLRGRYPPTLRFSPEGLDFSGFGVGAIAWRDIRRAQAGLFLGRAPMVVLELQDEQKYLSRRAKSRRPAFGFAFGSPVLELSPDMIVKAIDIRRTAINRTGSRPA